jgi:hypothetical protein
MKRLLFTLIVTFAFCGTFFAQQTSHWDDVNPYAYDMNYAGFVSTVIIDNNIITFDDNNWENMEIGAFVDGEIRAHSFLRNQENYGAQYVYPGVDLVIYTHVFFGTPEIGKEVTFKLYDHNTDYEYTCCVSEPDAVVTIGQDHLPGNPGSPLTLSFFHTYTKEIDPYSNEEGVNNGWYLISSPLNEAVNAEDVLGLRTPEFDFYSFNQSAEDGLEWINHKDEATYQLQPGVGYLYANSTGEDLTFIGAPYEGNGEVTLDYDANAEFPGWNLVGNPFAQTASIDRDEFYVMKSDGTEIITAQDNEIAAMEGIFVVAAGANEKVTFSPAEPNTGKGQIVLNVTQDRVNVIDRAIVRFGQGGTLPKFMLNQNNTKVYIPKENKDFAVVRTNNSGRLPVNFEPAEDGVYFINASVENLAGVRYLHLIDHEAGLDIDLLQEPIYKFDAKKNGKPGRFELVFKKISSQFKELSASNGNSFGFCNNGNWIINNEGDAVLQVIDVNGRILCNEEINGSVSKRIDAAPGVYMLRLINNNDVKVQKIVVE